MWTFPFRGRRGRCGAAPDPDRPPPPLSRRKKIIITGFILFHFGCVIAWVTPGTSSSLGFLRSRSLPLPARRLDPATNSMQWRIEPLPVITSYLERSGQWQNWKLFAPNPLSFNRYLAGRVTYRSGDWKEVTLPRVDQLDVVGANLEARYREYQVGLIGPLAAQEDLARFIARSLNDPANPAVRVNLYALQLDIPAHDRPDLRASDPPPHVDYSKLLRDPALYVRYPLLDYAVKPEDLR
jgi:hypothetical protein